MPLSRLTLSRPLERSPDTPRLDLTGYSSWGKLLELARFLPIAYRAISERRIEPIFTFHLFDRDETPVGISNGDVCYPATAEDVKAIIDIAVSFEDRRFYSHRGVDFLAIGRSILRNAQAGRIVQGASTITQQLIRNSLLTPDRSVTRKLGEFLLALKLERHYSKQEILSLYSQLVYLGPHVRGFPAAAKLIYRRPIGMLDIKSRCGLVGLLRHPAITYPATDSLRYRARQEFMFRTYKKSSPNSSDCQKTIADVPVPNPIQIKNLVHARWAIIAKTCLASSTQSPKLGCTKLTRVGLTIDRRLQNGFDQVLKEASSDPTISDVCGVVLCNRTSDVLAESSWSDGQDQEFSPVFFGKVQSGSTYKTFAYLAALESGFHSDLELESRAFESSYITNADGRPWCVRNYAERYLGRITLRDALQYSDNTAFARLTELIDLRKIEATYRRFGLCDNGPVTPAIVLGGASKGIPLLVLASAYATIARNGLYLKPRFVRYAKYVDGAVDYFQTSCNSTVLIRKYSVAMELRLALQTASAALIGYGFSGKSGTTRTGSIFSGYDDSVSLAIWLNHRREIDETSRKGLKALSVVRRLIERGVLGYRDDIFTI